MQTKEKVILDLVKYKRGKKGNLSHDLNFDASGKNKAFSKKAKLKNSQNAQLKVFLSKKKRQH